MESLFAGSVFFAWSWFLSFSVQFGILITSLGRDTYMGLSVFKRFILEPFLNGLNRIMVPKRGPEKRGTAQGYIPSWNSSRRDEPKTRRAFPGFA